jgi:IS1 family transposase
LTACYFVNTISLMANVLPRARQLGILGALVEGVSVRGTERLTDVSRAAILRLLVAVGSGCAFLLDDTMRDLPCNLLELDEIWGFIGKKQRHIKKDDSADLGDVWTFVAIDADTKLVPCFRVGKRDDVTTRDFIADLAPRMRHKVQITTDGFGPYESAIWASFGPERCDYATIVKTYESEPTGPARYSPPKVTASEKTPVIGTPDIDFVSTSYVERSNLTMRMQMRRLTRLTNAHSKKLANHIAATALHFAHYNYCRVHMTLRVTPAMEAGLTDHVWTMEELFDAAMVAYRHAVYEQGVDA